METLPKNEPVLKVLSLDDNVYGEPKALVIWANAAFISDLRKGVESGDYVLGRSDFAVKSVRFFLGDEARTRIISNEILEIQFDPPSHQRTIERLCLVERPKSESGFIYFDLSLEDDFEVIVRRILV